MNRNFNIKGKKLTNFQVKQVIYNIQFPKMVTNTDEDNGASARELNINNMSQIANKFKLGSFLYKF